MTNVNDSVNDLSNIYGVSQHVIYRRLLDTKNISQEEYDLKTEYDYENYDDNSPSESSGHYLYNQIKYNGRPFYSLILDAYDYGIISELEFSKYTNLGQNQIPKLQEILFGGEQ